MNREIKMVLDRLPRRPGVYLMKDGTGSLLYVGKAKDLRSRVRAYFASSARHSPKTSIMVRKARQIDFMITDSEVEAFILESNLIKKNRPRYNILLRDDKHYPYLRLSIQEDYPRLDVVRKIRRDGARYFGPYVPGSHLRSTLELIEKTFSLRKCKNRKTWNSGRPCLNAQIGRCLSPCSGGVSKSDYKRIVRQVVLFLQGKNRQLIRELSEKMEQSSRDLEYEKAAMIRDQIRRIEIVTEQQKMISSTLDDKDLFGVARAGDAACVEILFVRSGKLLGKKDVFIDPTSDSQDEEILVTALMQYYDRDRLIPPRVFIPAGFPELRMVENALSAMRDRRVRMCVPQRGISLKLIRMAEQNAAHALETYLQGKQQDRMRLTELQQRAGLQRYPRRIEAFDISNIQGDYPVASMVAFEGGKPRKSHYRHYRIESVEGANDYAMMEEVLMRRYRSEQPSDLPVPDLILVDGGKGQLNVLQRVVRDKAFLNGADLMAPAKARSTRTKEDTVDRIFVAHRKEAIVLDPADPVIHLLQRVRDESHRFAIRYYRKRHLKETLTSRLQDVPGVGKKRTLSLLRHFGSLESVRQATLEELTGVPSMNREVASRIFDMFHREASPSL